MVLVSCCKDNTTPAQNQIFRCGRRFRAGASAVGCPALCGANACRGPVSVYFAAGQLYACAGWLGRVHGRAHGWSRLGREPCGVCGVSRAMPERGVPEEFRGTSGHKKSGRPRLFGLPQAGVLLESGSCCYQKTFGMCDPCLREYFPGSRRCCEAAPDSAEKRGFNNYFLLSNVSVMFIGYSFSAYCLVASSEYL